jgi:hypothetical protein
MRTRLAVPVVLGVCVAVLAACQSPPAPSPTPTVSAVASVPSVKSSAELFAEGSAIYRKMKIEMDKLEVQGGADELPPELTQYITGDLVTMLTAEYRSWKQNGTVLSGEPSVDVWVVPYEKQSNGSAVVVAACTDSSRAIVREGDGTPRAGVIGINYYYFKRVNGRLVAFDAASRKVDKC